MIGVQKKMLNVKSIARFAPVLLILALIFGSLAGCSSSGSGQGMQPGAATPAELYVLAAASLADAMKELAPMYEASHPGQKLVTSFGSSGTLQQQIEQGAPADLFLSAAAKQMEALVEKGFIDEKNTVNLLQNQLVLVVPLDAGTPPKNFADLKNPAVNNVAIGNPQSVPAGAYAKETLTNLGIWDMLKSKFVFAKDVRQVLSYVETGNADAGIVYKTDAMSSGKVAIAATADEKSHSPIVYPLGIVKHSKHPEEAKTLYDWLQGPEATAVFDKYGFEPAGKP